MFIKKVEDFICVVCRKAVIGTGYTNHCPHCLSSLHVDIDPGDRKATCGGVMKPTNVSYETGKYYITHTCGTCGHTKKNRVQKEDDFDTVAKTAQDIAANTKI